MPRVYRFDARTMCRSFVIPGVSTAAKQPAAQRAQPLQHVVHVAEVHDFDQIPVEIPSEEEGVPARRAFRRTEHLHAFTDEVIVPLLRVLHVEGNMREAHAVPLHIGGSLPRCELENLQHAPAGYSNPPNLAGGVRIVYTEEAPDAVRRRIRHTHERTSKYV